MIDEKDELFIDDVHGSDPYFSAYVYLKFFHQSHHQAVHLPNNKEELIVVLRKLLLQALMQLARRWMPQADALKSGLEMHPLDLQIGLQRANRIVVVAVGLEGLRVLFQGPDDDWQHAEGQSDCLCHG